MVVEWKEKFIKAIEVLLKRIQEKTRRHKRDITNGFINAKSSEGTPREKAVNWRVLEIKIERDKKKAQRQLVDSPLPEEELELKQEAATRRPLNYF